MPHAISIPEPHATPRPKPHNTKKPSKNRTVSHLLSQLDAYQTLYHASPLALTLTTRLRNIQKTTFTPLTRILSLGLGTLSAPQKGQTRRLKQLAILLGLRDTLHQLSGTRIQLYAQDPTFSRADEALLSSLDVQIVRTGSAAELGEAEGVLGAQTLVYAPFLTLDAYECLLVEARARAEVRYLLGDDFEALAAKWPRYSAERGQVERVMKLGLARYRRRRVGGEGFWTEEDQSFPMAWYEVGGKREGENQGKL